MFAPTSLRSQAGGYCNSRWALENHEQVKIHIRHVLKCDSIQEGYTSPTLLLLLVVVHKFQVQGISVANQFGNHLIVHIRFHTSNYSLHLYRLLI